MTEKQAARKLASINKRLRALEAEASEVFQEFKNERYGVPIAKEYQPQFVGISRIEIAIPLAKVVDKLYTAERAMREAAEIMRGNPFYYEAKKEGWE